MRLTLEELRAMTDVQLGEHWIEAIFPFENLPACGNCLTQHDEGHPLCEVHPFVRPKATWLGADHYGIGDALRPHLEELFSMRLFYDHLYSQSVEPAEPAPAAAEQQVAETMEIAK